MKAKKFNTITLVKISVLASLGTVLMFFPKIGGIFLAPWLDLDLANVPELIGTFALGPLSGVVIAFIRNLLHFFLGSTTGGVGELSNFLVAVALLLPAGLIYKRHRNFKSACLSLGVGIIVATVVACVTNLYIILPMFFKGMDLNEGLQAFSNGDVSNIEGYVIYSLIPFNLLKGFVNALVVALVYKKLRKII